MHKLHVLYLFKSIKKTFIKKKAFITFRFDFGKDKRMFSVSERSVFFQEGDHIKRVQIISYFTKLLFVPFFN